MESRRRRRRPENGRGSRDQSRGTTGQGDLGTPEVGYVVGRVRWATGSAHRKGLKVLLTMLEPLCAERGLELLPVQREVKSL